MGTPWSTEVAAVDLLLEGDDSQPHYVVRTQLLLSTDPGPMRMFREFLTFDLDEAHATELLGKLTLALLDLRQLLTSDPQSQAQLS